MGMGGMSSPGLKLDLMILMVFSNVVDSIILRGYSKPLPGLHLPLLPSSSGEISLGQIHPVLSPFYL